MESMCHEGFHASIILSFFEPISTGMQAGKNAKRHLNLVGYAPQGVLLCRRGREYSFMLRVKAVGSKNVNLKRVRTPANWY